MRTLVSILGTSSADSCSHKDYTTQGSLLLGPYFSSAARYKLSPPLPAMSALLLASLPLHGQVVHRDHGQILPRETGMHVYACHYTHH
jgi:hypothetical protein